MATKRTRKDYDDPRPARKTTRQSKADYGAEPTPKPVEVGKVEANLNKFHPTETQYDLIEKVASNVVTFVDGPAGTGKTSSVLWYFAKQYLFNSNLEIIITRTPAEVGKDKLGFLPDDKNAKCEPHFASTRKVLEDLLGKGKVTADLDKRIHFTVPNYLLGSTMDNKLWLIDEAQLLQPIIMKLLLERVGRNTKVVVSGSSSQIYTGDNGRGGMQDAIQRFFHLDGTPKYDDFAYKKFYVHEVMRSDVVKSVLHAYGDV